MEQKSNGLRLLLFCLDYQMAENQQEEEQAVDDLLKSFDQPKQEADHMKDIEELFK